MTQMVVCETEDQYVDSLKDAMQKRPSLRNSLSGLQLMRERDETYIRVEKEFRKRSSDNLVSMEEAAMAAEAREERILDPTDKPSQSLKEPLLANRKPAFSPKR